MIAGLPVHWVSCMPRRESRPECLDPETKVYVRGFDGSEPQHPMRAGHVHWENIVAYAISHPDSDQRAHRPVRAGGALAPAGKLHPGESVGDYNTRTGVK